MQKPIRSRHDGFLSLVMSALMAWSATTPVSAEEGPVVSPAPTLAARCGLPFRDHAVLQQQIPLPVWGSSLPGATVTVTFDSQARQTTAGDDGKWRVVLDPMTAAKLTSVNEAPAGKPMVVTCEKDGQKAVTTVRDLLVGEVWLCAGQSNMAGKMRTNSSVHFPPDSIKQANYPALRQLVSPEDGPWLVCTPETAPEFKKVCFFFARAVQHDALVPVGVINASVGGSRIETWLNEEPYVPGGNYQRIIVPLLGYGLRGTIWYQGESNAEDGLDYLPKLRSLINGWRRVWHQPDSTIPGGPRGGFSFYFVQLPGIGKPAGDNPAGGDGRAGIRQAFFSALALPNTGMAVTLDVGAEKEHPPNKYDTGVRLARLALHYDYGFKDLVPAGPLYKSHRIEGKTVRIEFDHAEHGLMFAKKEGLLPPVETPDAKLDWLSMQGGDGAWHWADGRIDGSDLIVSCPQVTKPAGVRYAFTNQTLGTLLYNKDGLPAGPFSIGAPGAADASADQ